MTTTTAEAFNAGSDVTTTHSLGHWKNKPTAVRRGHRRLLAVSPQSRHSRSPLSWLREKNFFVSCGRKHDGAWSEIPRFVQMYTVISVIIVVIVYLSIFQTRLQLLCS